MIAEIDEDLSGVKIDDSAWAELPSLIDWPGVMPGDDQVIWLRRQVQLRILDFCVAYFLDVTQVPGRTEFYINGKPVGWHQAGKGRYAIDVTPQVFLGENVIALQLQGGFQPDETFGRVRLEIVPCDEL